MISAHWIYAATTHILLDKALRDYDRLQYNTVVAGMMELLNALDRFDANASRQCSEVFFEGLLVLNKILAPIAPHIAHQLWQNIGMEGEVIDASWPSADPAAMVSDTITLAIQVNGKLRGEMKVAADASKEQIKTDALASEKVQNHVSGKPIRKVIVVPGRLINIVV